MSNRTAINNKARREIAKYCEAHNLTRCEVKLYKCQGEATGAAHRHKRVWYYDKPDHILWHPSQWVASCQHCHELLEYDKLLTAQVFEELRGAEVIS